MLGLGVAKKIGLGKIVTQLIVIKNKIALKKQLYNNHRKVKARNKQKIFVIGFNKTGTTTIEKALSEFDIIMGHQRSAEELMDDIMKNNFVTLIEYCKTAEAFQDVPFSLSNIYKILDQEFPNSKFILTIRDNDEQWFNSLTNFHSKLWGGGKIPTAENLANVNYVYKGYALKNMLYHFGDKLYDKENYTTIYNNHNNEVIEYFKDRPNDFISINVTSNSDYTKLCNFIGVKSLRDSFSWENKTNEIL